MPVHWLLWLAVFNLVVPLSFLDRLAPRIVVGMFLASGLLMWALLARTGFSRVLGLGHVLWIPLLYFLWTRLDPVSAGEVYRFWIQELMTVASGIADDLRDVQR